MEKLNILIDTREQTPWTFKDHETERATLATGDYSLKGFTDLIAIERKSLPDLVSCVTSGRDRFKAELQRMRSYRCKAVIVESTLKAIVEHQYRSKTLPRAVLGSLASWQTRYGIPIIFAGDDTQAALYCEAMLRTFVNQLREYLKTVEALK